MITFCNTSNKVVGLVLNLEAYKVSIVVLGDDSEIFPGDFVCRNYVLMNVPTGDYLLGRVVDPLGNFLDFDVIDSFSNKNVDYNNGRFMESRAPSIISRTSVNLPLETGLKVIDSMVPIGHGQRELIIGDSKTGKTSIAIDTILNQKKQGTICIYVAIGQKKSSVARISKVLFDHDAINYSIIVSSTAADSAATQYLAPYSGCSIGEFFMYQGLKVLCIYD